MLSSIRQGCPLSPLLFALYLEPYCLSVIKNSNIRGFSLNSCEVKILAYADDVVIFGQDRESVAEAVQLTRNFCAQTASVVNWSKCLCVWHGHWDATPQVFESIQWSTEPGVYLGVPLSNYRESNELWCEEIKKMSAKTAMWGGRDFSIFARATVCKLFMVAKICYLLQVLHCSRVNLQRMHRVFAVYIWNSTWERIKRDNLFRRVKSGGISLSHLFIRQLVSRFFFLRDQADPFLRTVIQVRLFSELPDFIISSCDFHSGLVNGFLREVVAAYRFLSVRFSKEYLCSVTRKKLARDLVESLFPVPLYRALYSDGSDRDVLCRVKRMPLRGSVETFFFF